MLNTTSRDDPKKIARRNSNWRPNAHYARRLPKKLSAPSNPSIFHEPRSFSTELFRFTIRRAHFEFMADSRALLRCVPLISLFCSKNAVLNVSHSGSSTSLSAPIVNEADHGEYAPKIKELTEAVMKAAGTLCIHQLTDPTFRGRLAHGRD